MGLFSQATDRSSWFKYTASWLEEVASLTASRHLASAAASGRGDCRELFKSCVLLDPVLR